MLKEFRFDCIGSKQTDDEKTIGKYLSFDIYWLQEINTLHAAVFWSLNKYEHLYFVSF